MRRERSPACSSATRSGLCLPRTRAGDEKDPMGFHALRRMQDNVQKMYAPVSPEAARRRDELVARFLARQFSAAEMREIAAFLARRLLEKMEDALVAAAEATMGKCGFNPTYDIDPAPPVDPEKREIIYKLAEVRDATESSLPILACQDVLAEQAWSQLPWTNCGPSWLQRVPGWHEMGRAALAASPVGRASALPAPQSSRSKMASLAAFSEPRAVAAGQARGKLSHFDAAIGPLL
jgi:hypothetical protein